VPARHLQRGADGEAAAAAWYEARGYAVVARNWRCRDGELDLILWRANELVFCEVKSRASDRFGLPAEAVTPTKQRRIRGLAMRWLAEEGGGRRLGALRFDVACVLGTDVTVIEAAF
jgi:putative endonuclease